MAGRALRARLQRPLRHGHCVGRLHRFSAMAPRDLRPPRRPSPTTPTKTATGLELLSNRTPYLKQPRHPRGSGLAGRRPCSTNALKSEGGSRLLGREKPSSASSPRTPRFWASPPSWLRRCSRKAALARLGSRGKPWLSNRAGSSSCPSSAPFGATASDRDPRAWWRRGSPRLTSSARATSCSTRPSALVAEARLESSGRRDPSTGWGRSLGSAINAPRRGHAPQSDASAPGFGGRAGPRGHHRLSTGLQGLTSWPSKRTCARVRPRPSRGQRPLQRDAHRARSRPARRCSDRDPYLRGKEAPVGAEPKAAPAAPIDDDAFLKSVTGPPLGLQGAIRPLLASARGVDLSLVSLVIPLLVRRDVAPDALRALPPRRPEGSPTARRHPPEP
jgi:hypothetical protein